MKDEVIKLLEDKKLKKTVVDSIEHIYGIAGTIHDNPTEEIEKFIEETGYDLWDAAWEHADGGEIKEIDDAFNKYVFCKMRKPYIIEPDEIKWQFKELAIPGYSGSPELETIDFETLYTIFVQQVKLDLLSHRNSKPFPICIVSEEKDIYTKAVLEGISAGLMGPEGIHDFVTSRLNEDVSDEILLWEKNGIRLLLLGKGLDVMRADRKAILHYCSLRGQMSKGVCQLMENDFRKLLPSIMISLKFIKDGWFRDFNTLPSLEEDLIESNRAVINNLINAYLEEPSKKDTLNRRVRNAIHFLVESDNQASDAVGMALSVTALESLLGEKSNELSEKLATDIAVLLEPDLKLRGAAKEYIKKEVYNSRSKVLHGESLEVKGLREKVRHLATVVLFAVMTRMAFMKKGGFKPETPQDLLEDLRKSQFRPGQPMGVDEYNARKYWKK